MKKIINYTIICLLLSCAVKSPPTGGPLDLESPYIINLSPLNGLVNIGNNENIEIYFNEMIDPNSVKSAITISPEIDIIVNSYGKRIQIKPKNNWPDKSEFKIKVRRSISDYNGNYMNSGKVLTYSTSDNISRGIITGSLFNIDSLKYCTVGLYEFKNDSLQFYSSIESDNNNNFEFNNVKNGEYIVLGLMNQIRNIYTDYRLYPYGFFNKKIILDDMNYTLDGINIYIDSPNKHEKLLSVNMINEFYGEILLTNNEKLFLIDENYFNKKYQNLGNYYYFNNNLDSIYFTYDIDNNIESYEIEGSHKLMESIIDTIPPIIVNSYIENNKHNIEFSEPVIINKSPFYTINSSEDSIYFNFRYIDPKLISLDNADYDLVNIHNMLISDLNSNLLDTHLINVNKLNENLNDVGNIYGEVIYKGENKIIVEIINTHSGDIQKVRVNELNKFKFSNIYPDKYKIWAYENINLISDNYFNGIVYPLQLSSKFGVYNEMIEIRANWDIEGIKITIMDNN